MEIALQSNLFVQILPEIFSLSEKAGNLPYLFLKLLLYIINQHWFLVFLIILFLCPLSNGGLIGEVGARPHLLKSGENFLI